MNVADVNVSQPSGERLLAGADERFGRGCEDIEHFEVRMERRKMQRYVRALTLTLPSHSANLSQNRPSAPVDRRHDHIALAVSAHLPGDAARGFASCRSNKKILQLSLIAFSDLDRSLVGSVRDHRFDQFWICVWANLYDPEVVFIGF